MIFRNPSIPVLVVALCLFLTGCSTNRWIVNKVAAVLAGGGGSVFSGDDDPELVAAALPFGLKLYESLLQESPENEELLLATGSAFVMYANAFVHTPAGMVPEEEYETAEHMRKRAGKLYLRGRDYVLKALELRHPGIRSSLAGGDPKIALIATATDDIPYLYWGAAGWLGAASAAGFDLRFAMEMQQPVAMLLRVLELDENHGGGTAHELLVSYYGSVPAAFGGSEKKARHHFDRAAEISKGSRPGPYLALARSVCVRKQDLGQFKSLLQTALAIDPDAAPDARLQTILAQQEARWLLDHAGDFFIVEEESDVEGE